MKFAISLALLTFEVMASPIQVFYEEEPSRAEVVRDIFTTEYQIPEELIALKEVSSCDALKKRGKLEVCLKNNGDLMVVSADKSFISESLQIFQAP